MASGTMEGLTASVSSPGSVPRLRVTRHATSPTPHIGEQDSLAQATPRLSTFKHTTHPDSQSTSEDEFAKLAYVGTASRLLSASLPPDSSTHSNDATHRLRAVLNRFDTPSRSPAAKLHIVMPPSPSEPESDFDLRPAQVARASIKDLFKNALREPGDTPHKPKLIRRASFNAVASPKVNRSRRKSTSDEEREISSRRSHAGRLDLSAAESLDRLRLQLTESMSSVRDVSSIASTFDLPSEALTKTPGAATHLPRQSKIAISNTSVSHAKSHKDLEPFRPVHGSEVGDTHSSQRQRSHSRPEARAHTTIEAQSPSDIPVAKGSATVSNTIIHDESTHYRSSRLLVNPSHSDAGHQARDANHQRPPSPARKASSSPDVLQSSAPSRGRLSPGAWPTPPPPGSRPSLTRSPRHSLNNRANDGHSEDGNSSRSSSAISNAELRDRLKENELERQHELERSWNLPHSRKLQSTPHSHEKLNNHIHTPRPASSLGHSSSSEHIPDRSHSQPGHDRPGSASPSSSTSSRVYHEEESDEECEVKRERERNWNAPHPKWGQHTHHDTVGTTSPELSMPPGQDQQLKHTRIRTSSSPSSHGHSRPYPYNNPAHDSHSQSSLSHRREGSRSGSPTYFHPPKEEDREEQHKRERNWNAPRPRWDQHTDHHTTNSALSTLHSHPHTSASGTRVYLPSESPLPSTPSSNTRRPSPNSPHPPLINDFQQSDETGVDYESNGNSRAGSPSARQDHTPPSEPWSSTQRLKPKSNGRGPASRSDQEPGLFMGLSKRHRRTTTELSESMGSFPKQNGLPPSLTMLDASNASLFADESVPPPQMSTPTYRSVHLPDLSISPVSSDDHLPISPTSPVTAKYDPATRADADLARLQRAVAPNFTFPARSSPAPSPIPSPPAPNLPTSPRQLTSTSSPRLALEEHSVLPEAHAFAVEEITTPSKDNEGARSLLSAQKTPRFPGAFSTSIPSTSLPPVVDPIPHQDHMWTMEEAEATPKIKAVDGLPQTCIETNSYSSIPPTPALPGAYLATPTPAKRKGILKVRFDGDLHAPVGVIEGLVVSTGKSKSSGPSSLSSSSEEDVPPLSLSPTRRKGLRHVDEYGRVRRFTEDGEEIMLDTRRKAGNVTEPLEPVVSNDMTMTPRRRAKMRQVDALGNEVIDSVRSKKSKEKPDGEITESRRKNAVFTRLAKSLGELQDELAEEENALVASVPSSGQFDGERMMDLATVSKAARVERNKLSRKLQLERHEEDAIADKVFVARNPKRDMQSWETSERTSWWQRKWRLVIVILILELALLYTGYRLAMIHAKHIWLRTHFDPFFPALYLHQSRPGFLSRYGSLPRGWSAFAISGAVQRVGVRGFIVGVSKKVWEDIWSWRLEPWEAWGSPAAGPPVPRPWPS